MTNNEKICGMLGLATRAGKIVFGTEACKSSLEKRKIKLLLVANDASDRTKMHFRQMCQMANIPVWEGLTVEMIGKAIGKENKVILGITDGNFSKAILKIIDGGEVIG